MLQLSLSVKKKVKSHQFFSGDQYFYPTKINTDHKFY